jgi:hypothetical protein
MDSYGSAQGQVAGFCEQGNEISLIYAWVFQVFLFPSDFAVKLSVYSSCAHVHVIPSNLMTLAIFGTVFRIL